MCGPAFPLVSRVTARARECRGFSRGNRPTAESSTAEKLTETHRDQLVCDAEVSGHLVGSPAFKAGEWGDPPLAGSIPVHLRYFMAGRMPDVDTEGNSVVVSESLGWRP